MKRLLFTFCFFMSAASFWGQLVVSYHVTEGGVKYDIFESEKFALVSGPEDKNCEVIEIYEEVDGYKVLGIESLAFSGCNNLSSVSIPNSVTTIGYQAFYGCSSLASASIPSSVTRIGYHAFQNCSSLTSVTIPGSLTTIERGVFYGCSNLSFVSIPSSVTSIGSEAFQGCSSLTSISIPNSVTSIGSEAFQGCSSLTSVTIPNSMTTIGMWAFSGISGLKSVVIPSSVTSIEYGAFSGCSSLISVTIPGSLTNIDKNAFYGCVGLQEIYCNGNVPLFLYDTFDEIYPNAVLYYPITDAYAYSLQISDRFMKIPYITDLKQLTESKQYYIRANRGALGVANGELAATNPNAQSRKCEQPAPFAILQWNDYYCLYSTVDGKYITANGGETDTPSDAAFWKLFRTDDSVRFIFQRFGYPAILNINDSYGITIDGWNTADDGNMFMICEADVFSPVDIPFVVRPNLTGKIFTLNCKRGYVGCNNGRLCGTTQDKASRFAVIDYNGTNYLYDVTNQAFVCHSTAAKAGNTGNLLLESNTDLSKAVTGLSWGKTPFATYPWHLEDSFGNWLNMDGQSNVYMNTWKDYENGNGGNTYWVEIADYDYSEAETEAIEILNQYYQISGKSFVLSYNDGNDKLYVGYSSYYEDYRTYPSDGPSRFAIVQYKGLGFLYDVEKKVFFKGAGAVTLRKSQDYYEFEDYSGKKLGISKDDGHILDWYDVSVQDNYVNLFMAESIEDFDATEAVQKLKGCNYTFYTFVEPDGNIVRTMDTYSNGFSTVTGVPDYQRKDYCSYFMPPATIADGKNEITALVSYNLPFTVSTDYFTATWYLARIRDNYYINMSNSEPYYPKATRDTNFNFQWAFQGTPHTGFVILNNAAGPYKVLTKVGDYAVMRSGSEERWELIQNGDGFSFLRMGSEMDYINQNGGNTGPLGFWVSDWARTDKGSQWLIEEISTGIEEIQESERPVQSETNVWYTLDGRMLDAAMPDRKGIYIINGRKVVVR
ncbi:MAG: leucine-rich repeat domain-containing protein [Bacteroidaceae bacterium]|nr:leucine-rich repeat domain-containing protein [Bacteroidaceae bacterium]